MLPLMTLKHNGFLPNLTHVYVHMPKPQTHARVQYNTVKRIGRRAIHIRD